MSVLSSLTSQLAAEIREARDAVPMTQAELAKILKVSTRTIQEWESGDTLPRPKHRRALAKWLEKNGNGKKAA